MNLAIARNQQMVDEFERGCFAGAAAAEKDKRFSGFHFKVEFAHQLRAILEAIGNVAELNRVSVHRRGHRRSSSLAKIRSRRKAGNANSGMALVPDV